MINAGLPLERNVPPIAISGAGVALAWLVNEPSGLLVAVTGISVLGGRRASFLSTAVFGLALTAFILVVGWDSLAGNETIRLLAVFLAVGLGISGLIHLNQIGGSSGYDEREARLNVESMPGHGWSADANGIIVSVSPSTMKYVERPAESLDRIEGTNDFGWRQVVHPDDYDRIVAKWLLSLKTGEPYEKEHPIRRFDGTYRWFRNAGMPSYDSSGRITGWYGTTIDIHDQKTAGFALRESERRLQQLVDAVPALIWSTTREGTPTYVNKRCTDATGAILEDITASAGSPSLSVIHPDDRGAAAQAVARSFETGTPYVMRYRQLRDGGSYRWTETCAEPLRDEAGGILQWYGVSVVIDDLVTARQALLTRERELSHLVDMVPSHVWRLTPDGEPTFFNKRMVDFLGMDVADTGKSGISRLAAVIEAVVHPDDAAELRDALGRCLVTGEGLAMLYRLRRADGVYRWMSSRAEPMRDHAGRIIYWYGLCHDIDDQMHADEALRKAQLKLARATQAASLAENSATIAHEVNQPLAAIVATSHACRRWLSATPLNLEWAGIALQCIIRDPKSATEVVSRIRALFSHMGKTRSPADLTEVITEVCLLMADELAVRNIRLETEFDPSLPPALMDRAQMQQVLVNLIRNASDAWDSIGDGTRLIRLRVVLEGDNTIRVEVPDLGAGTKEPECVFEPFSTTKENGMGMDLSFCRSIIEAHDGRLWVTDNEPRGTTLACTLPMQARNPA